MKKIYSTLLALTAVLSLQAQVIVSSDFSSWTGNTPNGWKGSKTNFANDSIIQVNTGSVYGTSSVRLVCQSSSHRRFTTQPLAVTNGTNYQLKIWAKGKADVRFGIFDSTDILNTSGYHYSPYQTINQTNWTMYTYNITADQNYATAQFIISVRNSDPAQNHIQIDSAVIAVATPTVVSVYDIQYTTDMSGNSPYNNTNVLTGGIVTATHSTGYFIQSGSGPWTGIFVFNNTNTPQRGDSVTFNAQVTEYFNMTQLQNVTNFNIVSSGNPMPAASVVSTQTAGSEPYEGVLIQVNNANCTNPSAGFGEWTINDGSGAVNVDDLLFPYTPTLNTVYHITGVIYFSFGTYKILPRDINDIQIATGTTEYTIDNIQLYPNPTNGELNIQISNQLISDKLQINIYDISGKIIHSTTVSNNKINLDVNHLENGVYFLQINIDDKKYLKERFIKF
jgi:hypothetical protein